MTTYLGKSCSFGLPRVPFVNCRPFMYLVFFPFGSEGRMWDLIVSVPDHCLSFYIAFGYATIFQGCGSCYPEKDSVSHQLSIFVTCWLQRWDMNKISDNSDNRRFRCLRENGR